MHSKKRVWLTWEIQRRNRSLSRRVGAELFELVTIRKGIFRYMELVFRTFKLLMIERAGVVFAQNPSIVLCSFLILVRRVFGFRLVVDAHNSGLFPMEGNNRFLGLIARWVARRADVVIVSNQRLAEVVKSWGGCCSVLSDPLPDFELAAVEREKVPEVLNVFFVCTWAADEPYLQVVEAARMRSDVIIRASGKYHGKISDVDVPDNFVLCGFMSEEDYVGEMKKADAVIVLTTRDDCLNCGAYEALAMGKPMILSDTQALRKYFGSAALYVKADAFEISCALVEVRENISCFSSISARERDRVFNVWESEFEGFNKKISGVVL